MSDDRKEYQVKCTRCASINTLNLRPQDVEEWYQGRSHRLVQDIFYYLTPAERELLMSGLCSTCWTAVMGPES